MTPEQLRARATRLRLEADALEARARGMREEAAAWERAADAQEAEAARREHLPEREHSLTVRGEMQAAHRVAISAGRSTDPFYRVINAVRTSKAPKGYSMRSLAKALDIPNSLLAMHRTSRPIPRARAERIEALTGWPADLAHWPQGIS